VCDWIVFGSQWYLDEDLVCKILTCSKGACLARMEALPAMGNIEEQF
jgi:hypothetical protein